MNHSDEKIEIVFILECFTSCKAYCTGCNVNRNKTNDILFSEDNLKLINNRIREYLNFITNKNKKEYYISIALGPGDFMNLPGDKIIQIMNCFDDDFELVLAGNLSLENEEEKIRYLYANKGKKRILFEAIFNPLSKVEHKEILTKNLKVIRETFGHFDIATNLSESIYDKITPKELAESFLQLGVKENRKLTAINLTSSPNKILITRKEFQTSLEKETNYLLELFEVNKDSRYNMEFEAFFDRYDFISYYKENIKKYNVNIKDFVTEKYERFFFIDMKMNLNLTSGNLGDYHYNELNNLGFILNIKDEKIEKIFDTIRFKKLLTKQINGINFDKICMGCEYKHLCMVLPVYWQKERYKNVKGVETEEYCYGFKKINKAVDDYFDELTELYDKLDVY